ncbi:LysR family transcriptional regulator [Lutimaribacter marinistellae]|uniref:LysR family transcriptional regulator n=1 Tax=Lutimaribacter marinistellae TaxID=1820329 RepID=A0ABV7TKV0_9RHOB
MDRFTEMESVASVVDHGGFTDAAKKLGVSKSYVSKHVANLEARLGARLLNRTTRKVSPTEIGMAYYERARRVLNDAGDADAMVSAMQSAPAGILRIAVDTDFGVSRVVPILPEFLDAFPQIQTDLVLKNRHVELISEGFDMAIRCGDLEDSTLRGRKIATFSKRLIAAPSYLERHGYPQRIGDLNDHKLLNYSNRGMSCVWKIPISSGQTREVRVPGWLSVNDGQSLLRAAIAGLGIAYLPSFLYANAMKQGLVVDVMPILPVESQSVFAVYPPGRFTPPNVRALIDFLVHKFGKGAEC